VILFGTERLLLWNATNNQTEVDKDHRLFLKKDALIKAGFRQIESTKFYLVFKEKYCYCLNIMDRMVARYEGNKPDRVYHTYGQGVGEFLFPRTLLLPDPETIAVYDNGKSSVLYFDHSLNYKDEIKVDRSIEKLIILGNRKLGYGEFNHFAFAALGDNFEIIETFSKIPECENINNIPYQLLYKGYFLNGHEVAFTHRIYFNPECNLDIIDLGTKKIKLSLNWKHPSPPKVKKIIDKSNYYSYYVGKHDKFYVMQNVYSRLLKGKKVSDLLVFDENGKLTQKRTFQYILIDYLNKTNKLYFVDNEGNIGYMTIDEVLNE
jgi:hypothetical protein